jgi:hypothetical protein
MGMQLIWPVILFFSSLAFGQFDLSAVQELDEKLPDYRNVQKTNEGQELKKQDRRFRPPQKIISLKRVKKSGQSYGAIETGSTVINTKTKKKYILTKMIYVKYFNREDGFGFKYFPDEKGLIWKIEGEHVSPIKEELVLYVPPHRYTPAQDNIIRANYDKKLSILPELSFYTAVVQGDFMKDLLNDEKARSGSSNQYGLHFFTQWSLPIKVGAVIHYETSTFALSDGGKIAYSSPSIGPQLRTKEFIFFTQPIRYQLQFRVGPWARASVFRATGEEVFKFTSADLLTSIERPFKNKFGEFFLGLFFQSQWLTLKDQPINISIQVSNKTNQSFGISLGQVFE